jgi:hypothetical protein
LTDRDQLVVAVLQFLFAGRRLVTTMATLFICSSPLARHH